MREQPKKTAIILGTGATRGSGYTKCGYPLPCDRGFFEPDLVKNLIEKYPALDIMLDFFVKNESKNPDKPGMEEVWTFLDFCSKGIYSNLYNFEKEKKEWIEQVRDMVPTVEEHCLYKKYRNDHTIPQDVNGVDLSLIAGWELRTLISEVYRNCELSGENVYENFMEKFSLQRKETIFINLNYDTILEKALNTIQCSWYYPHIETSKVRDKKGIRVIKPHGSLNWLMKGNINFSITTNYGVEPVQSRCIEVNNFEQAEIIAPTQLKQEVNVSETQNPITTDLFSKIWKSMSEALVDAEDVFIIGYSFPPTDYHLQWLFRVVNRQRERKYKKVYCCIKTDDENERERISSNMKKFFSAGEEDYSFDNKGFKAFATK